MDNELLHIPDHILNKYLIRDLKSLREKNAADEMYILELKDKISKLEKELSDIKTCFSKCNSEQALEIKKDTRVIKLINELNSNKETIKRIRKEKEFLLLRLIKYEKEKFDNQKNNSK